MYKRTIDITCDWANDCVTIGSESFTLEQLKFEDAPLRQLVKDCLDETEIAQLRLAYPEWYNELFEIVNTTNHLIEALKYPQKNNHMSAGKRIMKKFNNKDYRRKQWDNITKS